jgi:hypothetical protein
VHAIRRWLRLWRVEPVEISSPLDREVAEARLVAGVTTRRQVLVGEWADPDARVVFGGVSPRGGRLTSLPRFARNSWSPLLRARLLPAGTGCRLVGTIGWHPFTRGFTAVWLGLASVFLVGGAGGFGVLVAGDRVTAGDVLLSLMPAVLLSFGVGLVAVAGSAGWRDAAFLRGWLAERLQATERP